ncbi:hypothetical protein LJC59_01240 [Desulfovibrio sp. OttesenSCG-928-A18]|nr:hypothetical protein [Desulfovibrio sp. OttesenSCG-928-A18]
MYESDTEEQHYARIHATLDKLDKEEFASLKESCALNDRYHVGQNVLKNTSRSTRTFPERFEDFRSNPLGYSARAHFVGMLAPDEISSLVFKGE